MPEIKFATIDAKESPVAGIDWEYPENVHNAEVMADVQVMYLNELLALQQRLRDKFEARLIDNKPVDTDTADPDDVHYARVTAGLVPNANDLWNG